MNVRLRNELSVILVSSLYEIFKVEIFDLIKELEFMTIEEFETKHSNKNYFELKKYKLYFSQTRYDIILKSIERK